MRFRKKDVGLQHHKSHKNTLYLFHSPSVHSSWMRKHLANSLAKILLYEIFVSINCINMIFLFLQFLLKIHGFKDNSNCDHTKYKHRTCGQWATFLVWEENTVNGIALSRNKPNRLYIDRITINWGDPVPEPVFILYQLLPTHSTDNKSRRNGKLKFVNVRPK